MKDYTDNNIPAYKKMFNAIVRGVYSVTPSSRSLKNMLRENPELNSKVSKTLLAHEQFDWRTVLKVRKAFAKTAYYTQSPTVLEHVSDTMFAYRGYKDFSWLVAQTVEELIRSSTSPEKLSDIVDAWGEEDMMRVAAYLDVNNDISDIATIYSIAIITKSPEAIRSVSKIFSEYSYTQDMDACRSITMAALYAGIFPDFSEDYVEMMRAFKGTDSIKVVSRAIPEPFSELSLDSDTNREVVETLLACKTPEETKETAKTVVNIVCDMRKKHRRKTLP